MKNVEALISQDGEFSVIDGEELTIKPTATGMAIWNGFHWYDHELTIIGLKVVEAEA